MHSYATILGSSTRLAMQIPRLMAELSLLDDEKSQKSKLDHELEGDKVLAVS